MILSPTGTYKKDYEYDTFGNTTEEGESFYNETQFTGAISDKSTGLQYMNARYYNPSTGRFLTQDKFSGNPYDPWTQNLYTYCGNNPVNFVDPTGHCFFTILGGLIGGLVGGIDAAIHGEDISAGIAGGVVSGVIMGAMTDITIATGGAAAPVAVAFGVGFLAGGLGNATTQFITGIDQGKSIGQAVGDINVEDVLISGVCGEIAGVLSNEAGKLIKNVVFDPVKDAVVNEATRQAGMEVVDYSAEILVKTATKTTLFEMGVNTGITFTQNVAYRGLKRDIDSLKKGERNIIIETIKNIPSTLNRPIINSQYDYWNYMSKK